MITRKQYLKSKPVCKVTFRLPRRLANSGRQAVLAGDFNNWQTGQTPMKALKSGDFTVTLALTPGREYQYRFLVDNQTWVTDPDAEKWVHCAFANCENSVVVV